MSAESVLIMVTASATTLLWLFVMAWREGTYLGRQKAWADSRSWMLRVNARQHEDHHTENHQLRGELKSLEEALGKHRADSATARNLLETQRKLSAKLAETLKNDADDWLKVRGEMKSLRAQVATLTSARDSLKAELADSNEACETALEAARDRTRRAEAEVRSLRADVAGLKVNVRVWDEVLTQARAFRDEAMRQRNEALHALKQIRMVASPLTLSDTDAEVVQTPTATPTPPPGFRAVQVDKVTETPSDRECVVWRYGSPRTRYRKDVILPEGVKFYDRDVTVFIREGVAV
jgi:hypothetical protein